MTWIWYFLGLVAIARAKHPAPFRTRPLSAVALMVLRLKTWESKSPPNLENTKSAYLSKRSQYISQTISLKTRSNAQDKSACERSKTDVLNRRHKRNKQASPRRQIPSANLQKHPYKTNKTRPAADICRDPAPKAFTSVKIKYQNTCYILPAQCITAPN